jgi:hypothetical protein
MLYVLFASTLLLIIYLWPALQPGDAPLVISVHVPSPEPVESVLKIADEHEDDKVDQQPDEAEYEVKKDEKEIKQPVQQVEEPQMQTAVSFSGNILSSKMLFAKLEIT